MPRYLFCLLLFSTPLAGQDSAALAQDPITSRSVVTAGDTAAAAGPCQRPARRAGHGRGHRWVDYGRGSQFAGKELRQLAGPMVARPFPKKIELVNAGMGPPAPTMEPCGQRDLLDRRPDFVVVEYGVNDPNSRESAETLEGLIRQILKQPQQPAVVLLFMMHRNGTNAQEWHGKVGRHYGLPMFSLRDALWPEIEAGRLKWEDVEADTVHPNDRGHAYAARFITERLAAIRQELPPDDRLPPIPALPQPLLGDLFEHVVLWEADALKPVKNEGWTLDAKSRCWKSDLPGSRIEFEIEGRVILVMDWHIRGAMGKAKVQVDDRPGEVRDAWFDQTWGGYRQTVELARALSPGRHRVIFEILPERNPESTGHEYRILGLGAAGLDSQR